MDECDRCWLLSCLCEGVCVCGQQSHSAIHWATGERAKERLSHSHSSHSHNPLTHSLTHSLTRLTPTHDRQLTVTHNLPVRPSLTHSLTHSITHSLTHTLTALTASFFVVPRPECWWWWLCLLCCCCCVPRSFGCCLPDPSCVASASWSRPPLRPGFHGIVDCQ